MRRGTFIMILVLFGLLIVAAVAQLLISSGHRGPFQGPTSPGQLPSLSRAPTP